MTLSPPQWAYELGRADRDEEQMANEIEMLRGVLREAKLQIEYLHDKFQTTGSGNAVLAKISAALNRH